VFGFFRGVTRPKVRWFVPVSMPVMGLRGLRGMFRLGGAQHRKRTQPVKVTVTVRFK
jgi:hypothetical protein